MYRYTLDKGLKRVMVAGKTALGISVQILASSSVASSNAYYEPIVLSRLC